MNLIYIRVPPWGLVLKYGETAAEAELNAGEMF